MDPSDDESSSNRTGRSHFKVVVVGAGIAGVTAAAKLINNGIEDITVLEAQDYIGGRIKPVMVGNSLLDLGAGFVHGQRGNPIYAIAKKLGVIMNEKSCHADFQERLCNTPQYFFSANGTKIAFEEVEELIEFIETSEKHNVESQLEEGLSVKDIYESIFQEFVEQKPAGENSIQLFEATLRWYLSYLSSDKGAGSLDKVGAWASDQYVVMKGNRYTEVAGGICGILQALVAVIPEGVIQTGVPVQCIDWDNASANMGKVIVHCENGDVITADHVIVTVSVGCLKAKQDTMFQPYLPETFQEALRGIEMGAIGKIFLRFDNPSWGVENNEKTFEFLWTEPYPRSLKADKSKKKTKFGEPWWQGIFSIEMLLERKNMIMIWLNEHEAEVVEQLDDDEVKEVLGELLTILLSDRTVSKPDAIYRHTWLNNTYIRGTYCYPGCSFKRSDVSHLTHPAFPSEKNPRLLFAGEGLTVEHISTLQGSYMTGEHQADTVLAANGIYDTVQVMDLVRPRGKS